AGDAQAAGPPGGPPDVAEVHSQTLWGSIGWATGGRAGYRAGRPIARGRALHGEGSHQLTAADLGTMARHGLKPVIFVLNNGGYMVERTLEANPDWVYNDLASWDYHTLPAAWADGAGSRRESPRSASSTRSSIVGCGRRSGRRMTISSSPSMSGVGTTR